MYLYYTAVLVDTRRAFK